MADHASSVEGNAEAARQQFTQQVQATNQAYQDRLAHHTAQHEATLRAKARRLLERAAVVEICLGQQKTLFETETYPTSFSESAVAGLRRHETPWTWMLVIGGKPLPVPQRTDPFYNQIRNEKLEALRELFADLTAEAKNVLQAWRAINP
jgi:hypothetical protein